MYAFFEAGNMRRILLLTFAALWFSFSLVAQFENPVTWKTEWKQINDTEYELIFKASIDAGWNIYSQYLESNDGPIATAFTFEEGTHFTTEGRIEEEGTIKEAYDKVFEMQVIKIFGAEAVFRQKIIINDSAQKIKGYITYMTCNDEMCLPPNDVPFEFDIASAGIVPIGDFAGDLITIPDLNQESPGSPVTWRAAVEQIDETNYLLKLIAEFEKPWKIYSQFIEEDGPTPTTFIFDEAAHYQKEGLVDEAGEKIKEGFDPLFGIDVKQIVEGPAVFTQRITTSDASIPITGTLEFMTCNDELCYPSDLRFFRVNLSTGQTELQTEEFGAPQTAIVQVDDAIGTLYGTLQKPNLDAPLGDCLTEAPQVTKTSLWKILSLGFLGGLIALLTPCVFPMIPLTVSFFTKSSDTQAKGISNAALYGGSIVLVYLLLSVPFHLLDSVSPDILNQISTNVWLNLGFFVVFLAFAFSFFGYYELTLPASWTNKSANAEGVGGFVGIFFMALTLALVSFSCTGPILGSLLVGAMSSDGGAWQLTAGMGGFGLGLALPFAVFAAFPGFMSSLPKSGGWLNTVKVTLGFLELALALKFLSNADMVKHWGFLKVELFLGLWILIFLGLGLYLFGVIRFRHDSPMKRLPVWRGILGGLSLAFMIYLALGFRVNPQMNSYRPLKLLSGLAPPVCYSFFKPCDCPQQLTCFKDLKDGLEYAKQVNKPVLLDFTGYACVNCRKMEEHVWPEPEIYPYLKDDYVLISLYVDDKKELPEEQQLRVETFQGTKVLRTYGSKWSYFQETYFNAVAQPYYVLLSPDFELLNNPTAYTPDVDKYASFLECGLTTFKQVSGE